MRHAILLFLLPVLASTRASAQTGPDWSLTTTVESGGSLVDGCTPRCVNSGDLNSCIQPATPLSSVRVRIVITNHHGRSLLFFTVPITYGASGTGHPLPTAALVSASGGFTCTREESNLPFAWVCSKQDFPANATATFVVDYSAPFPGFDGFQGGGVFPMTHITDGFDFATGPVACFTFQSAAAPVPALSHSTLVLLATVLAASALVVMRKA
jgi:hypothetical protein